MNNLKRNKILDFLQPFILYHVNIGMTFRLGYYCSKKGLITKNETITNDLTYPEMELRILDRNKKLKGYPNSYWKVMTIEN